MRRGKRGWLVVAVLLTAFAIGCGAGRRSVVIDSGPAKRSFLAAGPVLDALPVKPRVRRFAGRFVQKGQASWYGPGFDGKRTASGEIFDQYKLTAAHPSLPLGSLARVTNLQTGQFVDVRVNDRGPFVRDRVIDLSYTAAQRIGLVARGTMPVRIETLSAVAPVFAVDYAVQVGAYVDREKALALQAKLRPHYPPTYISRLQSGLLQLYQVRIGPFERRGRAEALASTVKRAGFRTLIVEEDYRWVRR